MKHVVRLTKDNGLPLQRRNDPQGSTSFLNEMLSSLVSRGRSLLHRARVTNQQADLVSLSEVLLSRRDDASNLLIAEQWLAKYRAAPNEERVVLHRALARRFGADLEWLTVAAQAFLADPTDERAQALHDSSEPRRQELFRRLNLADGGTAALVGMRKDIVGQKSDFNELAVVDADLFHLFNAWFNRGFLVIRPIDWTTSANILEKIIEYEAVHEIGGWDELRRRTEPADRRCFAFFHPSLVDDPLIFVEVALTREIPREIDKILGIDRELIVPSTADTAVFYSISNCQTGLRGISFGNFLIKKVAEVLKGEVPTLKRFVTLSPVPGFSRWLNRERKAGDVASPVSKHRETLKLLDTEEWFLDPIRVEALKGPLLSAAAHYLLRAKGPDGRPSDPVAKFHLGNGARLEQLNVFADLSAKGISQSCGLMVNYLYELPNVDSNQEAFIRNGTVDAALSVRKILDLEEADTFRN